MLWTELRAFHEEYRFASDALRSGRTEAIDWFPEGSFRPQLPFLGTPPPPCPPPPPTRPLEIMESEEETRVIGRGEVPIVEIRGGEGSGSPDPPT